VESWSYLLVSLFLLTCAAGLIVSHVHTWRHTQTRATSTEEFEYRRRQYRRRMQSSVMLAILAMAIFVGQWITHPPWLPFVYWGAVVLVVVWVGLLAVADMVATKHYFGRLRDDFLIEQAKLRAEVRRLQKSRSDGKAHSSRQKSRDQD
jgi:hypothetical protein